MSEPTEEMSLPEVIAVALCDREYPAARALRAAMGYSSTTGDALARHLGVSPQAVSSWRNGTRAMPPSKRDAAAAYLLPRMLKQDAAKVLDHAGYPMPAISGGET
jgi:transcriptional regulator with XRE-family HTH domain